MMKGSDTITAKDFMQFIDNTLKLSLKKREQHALIVLWDTNNNNTISKDEFIDLVKKGQRLLEAPPTPMKNNFLDPFHEDSSKPPKSDKKNALIREETVIEYSGNAKKEIIRVITESEAISLEQYFQVNWGIGENDLTPYDKFQQKWKLWFKKIPPSDLKDLFDEFDVMGNGKIKISNLCKDLK